MRHPPRRAECRATDAPGREPSRCALLHFHESRPQGERWMSREVGDDQHLIAQRRNQQQIHFGEHARHFLGDFAAQRSACTKSTADRKRACRNKFGHASGTCALSSRRPPLRVSSSNAAAAFGKKNQIQRVVRPFGNRNLDRNHAEFLTVSSAARSTSVAGRSFIQAGK